ncbi:MAG: hypothetical protein LBK46_09180 [Oscillospiraceae bacterium]|nr:hypothetical protein [Oscillospiraceae bacterium]
MIHLKRTSVAIAAILVLFIGIGTVGAAAPSESIMPVTDMTTGEPCAIADIFPDPEAAISAMESIVVIDMEENGNAYMENRDVTPLPLDRWEADAYGITVRYPADRLSTFSGRPGAYQFFWYELDGLYDPAFVDGVKTRARESLPIDESEPSDMAESTLVSLPGIPVSLGDDLFRIAMLYGGGKESDFTADKQVYRLEDARFRGVTVLTSRDDPVGMGLITEIRASRLDYNGLYAGVSDQQAVIDIMGEPSARELVDEDASYYALLPEGEILWYDVGGARLGMLVGEEGLLLVVVLQDGASAPS